MSPAPSWTLSSVLLPAKSSRGTSDHRISCKLILIAHRFILHAKKTAFVIEHDFIMATYLADRVIVFEGKPAVAATATP